MAKKYSEDELNNLNKDTLITLFLSLQDQVAEVNEKMDRLIEQITLANKNRYGRSSEKMEVIEGQLNLFNEAEALLENLWVPEPAFDNVCKERPQKQKGKRAADLSGLPVEVISHELTAEQLAEGFDQEAYKELPVETYKRLRVTPASYIVEEHQVHVYVGAKSERILRADHPADVLRNSIVTPSLAASIMNAKYVNAVPLYRQEQEFKRNEIKIARQVMANWMIQTSERYLSLLYDYLHHEMLKQHVLQADETPVLVTKDGRPAGSKSYMWVYRTGKYDTQRPVILYDYQRTRHHDHPETFLEGFSGMVMCDGYSAYRQLDREKDNIRFANCWAHTRRKFSDALAALKNKDNLQGSVSYKALKMIAAIYNQDDKLSELSFEERLEQRQLIIKPLVEAFFAWAKELQSNIAVPPKSKTAEGLDYMLRRQENLTLFLEDPELPLDNNATESALRSFCIGRNNWKLIDTTEGAKASAIIYSIIETAKANYLNPYKYLEHLLTIIPEHQDDKKLEFLEDLLPWSNGLPDICKSKEMLK